MLILRKTMVALTGLFLCLFLTVHLGANLILLFPESTAQDLYNSYSAALRGNFFIKIIAYLNYACFLFHIFYGGLITWQNRQMRKPRYKITKFQETSTWSSQNMGLLGSALFAFIAIHMLNFWYRVKFLEEDQDLYQMVVSFFSDPLYVSLYMVAMLPLTLHLSHGVKSAFLSLGLYHKKYISWAEKISIVYSWIVGIGFAIIPLVIYLKEHLS